MKNYNQYHLDPNKFPFIQPFQDNWLIMRDELKQFLKNASNQELKFTYDVIGPKSKTIKTKGKGKYSAFGILFQGMLIEEYIKFHQIQYPDVI